MKNVEDKLLLEKLLDKVYANLDADHRDMTERNREIFVARFAYDMTYDAIGTEFNLSVERVRQIVVRGQRMMQYHLKDMNLV